MRRNLPEPDKNKVYKFAKHKFENYRGTIMVDFFDKEYNRYYFHLLENGKGIFEVFKPRRHLAFKTDADTKKIKTTQQVIDILAEQGITVVLTNENMV